jgi:hypothetical protein
VNEGGRWEAPSTVSSHEGPETAGVLHATQRLLSAVLVLELLWLLLVAASVVFLAAHLTGSSEDVAGDPVPRRTLLLAVPVLSVGLGFALIGARQAVDRRATSPDEGLSRVLRSCLWLTAAANAAVVVTIVTSLYHARATWVVVGVLLAAGLSAVAVACMRTARSNSA